MILSKYETWQAFLADCSTGLFLSKSSFQYVFLALYTSTGLILIIKSNY